MLSLFKYVPILKNYFFDFKEEFLDVEVVLVGKYNKEFQVYNHYFPMLYIENYVILDAGKDKFIHYIDGYIYNCALGKRFIVTYKIKKSKLKSNNEESFEVMNESILSIREIA